jgi:hypothetical protein
MSFDPCNRALKIRKSFWDSNSQHGSSLGSVRVHSLTLFALPGACEVTPGSPSWSTTLQPPCLGREPKARVATFLVLESLKNNLLDYFTPCYNPWGSFLELESS